MAKLLMITGDRSLAEGKHGAFYNTLEEFHKYWDRVDIICPKIQNSKFKNQNNNVKFKIENLKLFENVFIHPSPWPLICQPLWIFKKGKEIYKEQNFDLITVHEYPPFYNGIGARLLWSKIKVPYILEIHHIVGYPKAANLKEFIYRMATRFFIKPDSSKAKAIRIVNKDQTKNFLIRSGISESKIIYIPSMYIDLDIFKPMNLPKEYDLIFVGRLTENKGIGLFLEAVKKIDVKAVIIGDGSLKSYCKLKIENWKLQDKILLYGWAKDSEEVANLLNKAKILVMPSYNEGGPRVVLEAMACGVPILATPVGLMPDFKSSITIINWDAKDIASKAEELLADKNVYEDMKDRGLSAVRQFEKKEAIKNYADSLKELIQ